jgi:large subunit ribosomal protein L9
MRIMLQAPVANLGFIGDIVTVKAGYARNFLIPRGLAIIANEKNTRQFQHQLMLVESKKKKALVAAQEVAAKVSNISITLEKPVGEEDRIFGTVTVMELVEEFQKLGLTFDRKQVKILEEIKKLGVYTGQVKVHPDVEVEFKIWVTSKVAT